MKIIIRYLLALVGGVTVGGIVGIRWMKRLVRKQPDRVKKFKDYYRTLYQWIVFKQQNRSMQDYFAKHGYQKIAIYGFGEVGQLLFNELIDTDVVIAYAIDQCSDSIYSDIAIRDADEFFNDVDVVVVSAVFDFDNISENIHANCPVISLNDILLDS